MDANKTTISQRGKQMATTFYHRSESFNPINYGFRWTADWYEFDSKAAHKAAMKARNARAKELKARGIAVRKSTNGGQLITRGGIGSGHPQIENIVSVYRLDYQESI
jgi:hypothetical protein